MALLLVALVLCGCTRFQLNDGGDSVPDFIFKSSLEQRRGRAVSYARAAALYGLYGVTRTLGGFWHVICLTTN